MAIRRILNKKTITFIAAIYAVFCSNLSKSEAITDKTPLSYSKPSVVSGAGIDEQAKGTIMIDGVNFSAYLKVKKNTDISDYPDNTLFGMRITNDGTLFYGVNVTDTSVITDKDKSSKLGNSPATKYVTNLGDLIWNYGYQHANGNGTGWSRKIGPIDKKLNFKPALQGSNLEIIKPAGYPYYPGYDSTAAGGSSNPYGRYKLYINSINGGQKYGGSNIYSGKIAYRNSAVKNVVDTKGVSSINGEWRWQGVNTFGLPIGNSNFPFDNAGNATKPSGKPTTGRYGWVTLSSANQTGYSDLKKYPEGTEGAKIRKTTLDRLNTKINPTHWDDESEIPRKNFDTTFRIDAPATKHLTGVVTGFRQTGNYRDVAIFADNVLDLELRKIEVERYVSKEVRENLITETLTSSILQEYIDKNVTSGGTIPAPKREKNYKDTDIKKIQPGFEYAFRYSITNRSGKRAYNPTANMLIGVGSNASSKILSDYSKAKMYVVRGNKATLEDVRLDGTVVKDTGNYNLDGSRRKSDGRVVTLTYKDDDTNSIASGKTYTDSFRFTMPIANTKAELKSLYGTEDPNAVKIMVAGEINKKHKISDESFKKTTITDVNTSTDNLFTDNDSIAPSITFVTHDLRIGDINEFKVYDKNNKLVEDGVLYKGESYTIKTKVYNDNKNWDTSINAEVDCDLIDPETGESIQTFTGKASSKIAKSSNKEVSIKITIPDTDMASITPIRLSISKKHQDALEDWYKGDSSVTLNYQIKRRVNFILYEAMGDRIGNEKNPVKVTVGNGETVNLKTFVSSNSRDIYNVKIRYTTSSGKTSETEMKNFNANNGRIDYFPFKEILPTNVDVKTYTVIAEVNPSGVGRIEETKYSDNTVTFEVRVVRDKANCTQLADNNKGKTPIDNTQNYVNPEYSSYIPEFTVKRRHKVLKRNSNGELYQEWSDWYDYKFQVLNDSNAVLRIQATEKHKITAVLFRSKYTKDKIAKNEGAGKINSSGYVDILKYPSYARVKAGYGFEFQVRTKYVNDIVARYNTVTSAGLNTRLDDNKIARMHGRDKLGDMYDPDGQFDTSNMSVEFLPKPTTTTISQYDSICMVMPDGKKHNTSYPATLIEDVADRSGLLDNVYADGKEWKYQLKERNDGLNGTSRKYYISKETTNSTSTNVYKIRVATSRIGAGGYYAISNSIEPYSGNSTTLNKYTMGVYDVEDFVIHVYGGSTDDLKDSDR